MKLLITGPPGSGKTSAALAVFRGQAEGAVWLVPTATMAQHLRHELARAGDRVRPGRVLTLASFVEPWIKPWRPATAAALDVVAEQALEELRCPALEGVREFRGFRRALAGLFDELSSSGCGVRELCDFGTPIAVDLARLFERIEERLAATGMAQRGTLLNAAAEAIRSGRTRAIGHVFVDGFFSFTAPELGLLDALSGHAGLTVTLPSWEGAEPSRNALLERGFTESVHERNRRNPDREMFAAPTLAQETDEIARRILDEVARGRPFRELGVLVRSHDPYVPALRSTFERFGIPARFYFTEPLAAHPAVAFLSGVMQCLLSGWDHGALLRLLRLPVSGIGGTPAGDRFDFAMRDRLPGTGLASFLDAARDPHKAALIESLERLEGWREESLAPQPWVQRLASLPRLLPSPHVEDEVPHERAFLWRSRSMALEAFEQAAEETADALKDAGPITLAQFWRPLEDALADTPLRVSDARRNVVHVLDAYEARQWELPVVFVCGLVERRFPQYHAPDPLLGDAARRRLGLRTSGDRQREEQFLFDLVTTRATGRLVLSHPRFDEGGEELIPSFFLRGVEAPRCQTRVRPRPARARAPQRSPMIYDGELRSQIEKQHETLSPSAIESYIQCPYQFFARHTLGLKPRPVAPHDRLDVMIQGSIIHRVLAEMTQNPLFRDTAFDRVFDEECSHLRIPRTYRTEAVRLEMLRNLEAFLADTSYGVRWPSIVETPFTIPLEQGFAIRGRIDRIDIAPDGTALVIDYKYSSADGLRRVIDENQEDTKVQGGLYLLAAERQLGYKPIGMLFCGLRGKVQWAGWHTVVPGLEEVGTACQPDVLRERMNGAKGKAEEVHAAIPDGDVRPKPADPDKCPYCDFQDICRVESQAEVEHAQPRP